MEPIHLESYLARGTCVSRQEEYLERLQRILSAYPHFGVPHEPTEFCRGVFLGTTADAEDHSMLKHYEITHIVNCSSPRKILTKNNRPQLPRDAGIIGFLGLDAQDDDTYEMRAHFRPVATYIKRARTFGGRVLICCSGVSTGATLAISYLLQVKNMYLLEATKMIKDSRRTALCNVNFMRQLVEFASECGLLDPHPEKIQAPKYGTAQDRRRLLSVHLPDIYIV